MEINGKCHKVDKVAVAFVLSGAIMTAGGIMAMVAGSTGTGTTAETVVSPAEQGPGVPAVLKAEPEEKEAVTENGVIQLQNLGGTKDADQLAVVVGAGDRSAGVYYYKKSGEAWEIVWKEAGIVRRNGTTNQKTERGDSTPSGTYGFTVAFGFRENPGSVLPRRKITKGDYWVDDSASSYYNRLVNTS